MKKNYCLWILLSCNVFLAQAQLVKVERSYKINKETQACGFKYRIHDTKVLKSKFSVSPSMKRETEEWVIDRSPSYLPAMYFSSVTRWSSGRLLPERE